MSVTLDYFFLIHFKNFLRITQNMIDYNKGNKSHVSIDSLSCRYRFISIFHFPQISADGRTDGRVERSQDSHRTTSHTAMRNITWERRPKMVKKIQNGAKNDADSADNGWSVKRQASNSV